MTYHCRHFFLEELVPPDVFSEQGGMAWELLDDRLLIALDDLRDRYGSITINSYRWGGNRQYSGLRTPQSDYYRPYSQHTFGRAADCLFEDISVAEVRSDILTNPDSFPLIRSLELDTPWLHIDVRNCTPIKTYPPYSEAE